MGKGLKLKEKYVHVLSSNLSFFFGYHVPQKDGRKGRQQKQKVPKYPKNSRNEKYQQK